MQKKWNILLVATEHKKCSPLKTAGPSSASEAVRKHCSAEVFASTVVATPAATGAGQLQISRASLILEVYQKFLASTVRTKLP